MEQNNNKATTIASLIAIAVIIIFVIFMAVKGLTKDNNDVDDIYDNLRQDATVSTETPTPTKGPSIEYMLDISDLLDLVAEDISDYLQSTNPNIVTFKTPGLTLEKLGSLRTALGKSNVETWSFWKADYDNATASVKGDYVINFNLGTENGSKKLYLYLWTDNKNGFYISMLSYEIGDF